jgi:hypothetical protein
MSAFLVGHDHIDALLTFAAQRGSYGSRASYYSVKDQGRIEITDNNATEIGRILLTENERSIRARYGDDNDMLRKSGEHAATYKFQPWLFTLTAVSILKGCNCFDYQARETDDYDLSVAHRIINAIRSHAIHRLSRYEDAKGWEFRRE